MSQWSQKLDAYIAANKITKRELAQQLGISIGTLEKWWGPREPSEENADKIRKLLNEGDSTPSQDERLEERSVVISLFRTVCPFCEHAIDRFKSCDYCGQHFVWANVPVTK